jgi:hypothetical protein
MEELRELRLNASKAQGRTGRLDFGREWRAGAWRAARSSWQQTSNVLFVHHIMLAPTSNHAACAGWSSVFQGLLAHGELTGIA